MIVDSFAYDRMPSGVDSRDGIYETNISCQHLWRNVSSFVSSLFSSSGGGIARLAPLPYLCLP